MNSCSPSHATPQQLWSLKSVYVSSDAQRLRADILETCPASDSFVSMCDVPGKADVTKRTLLRSIFSCTGNKGSNKSRFAFWLNNKSKIPWLLALQTLVCFIQHELGYCLSTNAWIPKTRRLNRSSSLEKGHESLACSSCLCREPDGFLESSWFQSAIPYRGTAVRPSATLHCHLGGQGSGNEPILYPCSDCSQS